VVVHHLSKRQDYDDHLDAVSSSTGFTGAADTILILANGPQGPTLYGKGRDIEEIETALRESCDPLSPFQGPVRMA
jgi:hypothetical protein